MSAELNRIIEALLFLENRPINIKYITKITGHSREAVQSSIEELKKGLDSSGSALVIESNDSGDYHLTISGELYDSIDTIKYRRRCVFRPRLSRRWPLSRTSSR